MKTPKPWPTDWLAMWGCCSKADATWKVPKMKAVSPNPLSNQPQISEVHLKSIAPQNGLVALARVVLDGCLVLDSIGVHTKRDGSGYRLTYPTKAGRTLFHPITQALSAAIEQAIFAEMCNPPKAVSDDRYGSADPSA
jgi:DNA-binding cell septation regulator SpoVG